MGPENFTLFFCCKNMYILVEAIICHPVYCVSRPLPDFRRVIRIQNAPEDFVPGTMPLRLKTVVEEMPLNFLYRVQCP